MQNFKAITRNKNKCFYKGNIFVETYLQDYPQFYVKDNIKYEKTFNSKEYTSAYI